MGPLHCGPWIFQFGVFVSSHMGPLRAGFPFPTVLQSSWTCSLLVFKARCFGGPVSPVQVLQAGVLDAELESLAPQGKDL